MGKISLIVLIALFLGCPEIRAEGLSVRLCCTPGAFYDVGNLASDGSGGRQPIVRPLEPGEQGDEYIFFNTFLAGEDRYAEPPATPSQEDIKLLAGRPLALALPQLSHFPNGAAVSVEQFIDGNQIQVDARIHYLGYSTAWLAPPHEYVHNLGTFTPGNHRVTLNVLSSDWLNPDSPSTIRGFIDFTVVAVPEPSTWLIAVLAAATAASFRRCRA